MNTWKCFRIIFYDHLSYTGYSKNDQRFKKWIFFKKKKKRLDDALLKCTLLPQNYDPDDETPNQN